VGREGDNWGDVGKAKGRDVTLPFIFTTFENSIPNKKEERKKGSGRSRRKL
jgi:hypothetical protein